jgi:hypothetical protein
MSFVFRLETVDGQDLGTFATAVPNWKVGDVASRRPGDSSRIVEVRSDGEENVWTVENT